MEHLSGEQPLSLMLLTPLRMQNVRGEKNAVGGCQTHANIIPAEASESRSDPAVDLIIGRRDESVRSEPCSRDATETKSIGPKFL